MATVAVIGHGHMGSRIVERLRQHGHDIVDDPGSAEVVFTVLPDDEDVREVVLDGGLFGKLTSGAVFADLSTTSPGLVEELAAHARAAGVAILDIEMSGSTPQVETGELILLVGGEEETLDRIRPVLETFAETIVLMGPIGAGSKMKLVVNPLLGVGMEALAEAIGLGEALGLDRDTLLEALEQMAAVAPAHRGKLANVRHDEYPVAFALRLMHKDFGLVLAAAEALDAADGDVDFSFVARRYDAGRVKLSKSRG